MSYNESKYLEMSDNVYKDDKYNDDLGTAESPIKVATSTGSSEESKNLYEKNGLQASVVNDNGQYTVVFRGSQGATSAPGQKDWIQDIGLNDPYAYEYSNSQFRDAANWIQDMQSQGKLPQDMSQVTFTGHSLGGALAQYAAVKYSGTAYSFSGPSPYNMLSPEERERISLANIQNFRRWDDSIPNMPPNVPSIGEQIFVQGSTNWFAWLFGAGGHDRNYGLKDGQLIREGSFGSAINRTYAGVGLQGLLYTLGSVFSAGQKITRKPESVINELWSIFPMNMLGLGIYMAREIEQMIKVLGGGSGAAVGKVMSIKDPIDRAAAELLLLHQTLDNIQTSNNKIIPDMEETLSGVKTTVFGSLGWLGLTIGDIDDIVYETQSDVEHHVDQGAIESVNQMVSEKKEQLQTVANGLKSTAANKLAHDQQWASTFGG